MKKLDIFSLIACRDVLLDAKRRIQLGYNNHICSAILNSDAKSANKRTKEYLMEWVRTMLTPTSTYLMWLACNHPSYLKEFNSFADVNPGRLQWLDWMINQLETEIQEQRA